MAITQRIGLYTVDWEERPLGQGEKNSPGILVQLPLSNPHPVLIRCGNHLVVIAPRWGGEDREEETRAGEEEQHYV